MHLTATSASISGDRVVRFAVGLVTAMTLGALVGGCGSTATSAPRHETTRRPSEHSGSSPATAPSSRHALEIRLVVGGPDPIASRGTCNQFEADPLSHQRTPDTICTRYASANCPKNADAPTPVGSGWEMLCDRSRGTKYLLGPAFLGGDAFAKAVATTDPIGQKILDIALAPAFVTEFAHVTGDLANTGQEAAITFDGQLVSVAPMDARISTGRMVIVGLSNAPVIAKWINGS